MATDIYLSKEVLKSFNYGISYKTGEIQLWHEPCGVLIFEALDAADRNAWAFMEAMSKHTRECEATFTRRINK